MEGQTLSHYRVLEKLGGGGMGVVYKALDTHLDRHVALKFLPPELTRDDAARERFMLEAKAASVLDHPNICTIYEINEAPDGQMFIAMGYYEGETLKKRIERGPLPVEEALDIAIQVARGLGEAHAAGIVHRDIKPANVMLTKNGLVKIVDFGIAKLLGVTGPTQTGTTLGTVSYMSPEQVAGEDADQQSDVWSLGAVLYEMLTGQQAFKGENQWAVMNAIGNRAPDPPSSMREDVPSEVDQVVLKALEKSKDRRYASAAGFLADATAGQSGTQQVSTALPVVGPWQALRRPQLIASAVLLVAVLGLAVWGLTGSDDARRAREEMVPEVIRLIDADDYAAAFSLAEEAERFIPNDPVLAGLWYEMSAVAAIMTDPPAADVYIKPYGASDDQWLHLGPSLIEALRLPRGAYQLRIEKEGFSAQVLASRNPGRLFNNGSLSATPRDIGTMIPIPLVPTDDVPPSMVSVPQSSGNISLTGFPLAPVSLTPFFIDRTEVTNREYKEFVDANGYDTAAYWDGLEFIEDDRRLTWEEAMSRFRDSTGLPGPATWEAGDYPTGDDDHPVTGVSWYEAVAYAAFRGEELPTIFHWARAALPASEITSALGPAMVSRSNFGAAGPAPVATYGGMGPFGTYDMAGNVREWCLNAVGTENLRVTVGGGWSDAAYMFSIPYRLPPFDRSPINGFRLMKRPETVALLATLTDPVEAPTARLEAADLRPVSDEVFSVLAQQVAYEHTELSVAVESVDEGPEDWVTERVSFDSGYDSDRTSVLLYLPKHVDPPYQAVLFFPGVGPFLPNGSRSSQGLELTTPFTTFAPMDLVVRSGRALVWPIYWDSFERYQTDVGNRLVTRHTRWREDVGRTIDYLEQREDIQADALGYLGWSYGASAAVPLLALEDRIRAAVLHSGGLIGSRVGAAAIADPVNYLPRITIPVLMLGGRYDYLFPVDTSKQPMFDLIGTAAEHKNHVLYDTGHVPLPRHQSMRDTLTWFDKYLGPVN